MNWIPDQWASLSWVCVNLSDSGQVSTELKREKLVDGWRLHYAIGRGQDDDKKESGWVAETINYIIQNPPQQCKTI